MRSEFKRLEKYIKDIENREFSISLVNDIILLKNMTIDKEVREKIDDILKLSFNKMFKNRYQEILLDILKYTNSRRELCVLQNFISYNEILFCEEIGLDDYGVVDKKRYFVLNNNYLDIDDIKLMYDLTLPHEKLDYVDYFNNDREKELFRTLAFNINSISRRENLKSVVFSVADLSKNGKNYGTCGLIYKGDARVLVDFELKDLKKYIYNQEAVHLGMIIISGENFYCYDILQKATSDNMLNWTVSKKKIDKWDLNENLEKIKTKKLI